MSGKITSRDADVVSSQDSRSWSFLENSRHHKICYKNYGTGSSINYGMATFSPFLVPMLSAPLARAAQPTLREGTGKSPKPCDIHANTFPPSSWLERAIGQGSTGPWASVCGKILSVCCPLPFLWKTT